ncbi:MAG TPA: DUF6184 family natural product biosynthesis lipoprotein [Polyangiales bacterium]|nr:DUF6184 family natural product biosynthesis lipoprotein [Polyangiales bacterium]
MQKLTVCSLIALSSALAVGACHNNRRGPRYADRDHEAEERHRGHVHDGDKDHDEHNDEARDPDVGSGIATKRAVHAIAKARCEREKRCENVGGDKTYASLDACVAKIESEWAGDLNKYECPHGIVQTELDQCLADVRAEECGNPFDTLSRIAQCDADDICDGD